MYKPILLFLLLIISMSLFSQRIYENMREEFPGGEDSLICFYERNLNFEILNSTDKKGKVYLYLRIDSTGYVYNSITNPKLVKDWDSIVYDSNIENEILRVVMMMPRWEPRILKYKKVPITRLESFDIPYVNFKCKSITEE